MKKITVKFTYVLDGHTDTHCAEYFVAEPHSHTEE